MAVCTELSITCSRDAVKEKETDIVYVSNLLFKCLHRQSERGHFSSIRKEEKNIYIYFFIYFF